jgi:hypothetical protein
MVRPYSVTISDNSGNSALSLTPATNEDGTRAYREFRLPTLSPRTALSEDQVSFAQVPPEQELVWEQRDWSKGQGEFYYVDGFYAESDGIETRRRDEISLAPYFQNPYDVNGSGVNGYSLMGLNSNAESTVATFSGTGGTISRDTVVFNEGVASWALTATVTTSGFTFLGSKNYNDDGVKGAALKTVGMLRAANSGQPRLKINEATATSVSSIVTGSTFTEAVATQTMVTNPTSTGVGVEDAAAASTAGEVRGYMDELATFTQSYSNTSESYVAFFNAGSTGYTVGLDRMVMFIATLTGKINYVTSSTDGVKDVVVFDGRVYAAFGSEDNVRFNIDPFDPTWTANTTTPFAADKLAVVMNANGEYVLARAYTNSAGKKVVELSSNPAAATPIWGTGYTVGNSDAVFTALFEYDGTIYAGKTDGLFRFEPFLPGTSVAANRFIKVTPEFRSQPGSANLNSFVVKKAMERSGWLYIITKSDALWRYHARQNIWQDLTDLLRNDAVNDRGGKVVAIDQDGRFIYVVVQGGTNEYDIVTLRESMDGQFFTHTMHSFTATGVHGIWMTNLGVSTKQNSLYVLFSNPFTGGTTNVPQLKRVLIPTDHEIMRLSSEVRVHPSGQLVTSYMDWKSPDVEKSFNRLTILSEGLTTARTVTLGYEKDDDSSFSTLPTVTTSPSQTVSFPSGTTGRRIRLRYGLNTTNTGGSGAGDGSPVVKGHVLRASWRPTVLRAWEFSAEVAEGDPGGPGRAVNGSVSEVLSTLRTLEQKVAPIKFRPLDSDTAIDGHIRDVESLQVSHAPKSGIPTIRRIVRIRIEEAIVS